MKNETECACPSILEMFTMIGVAFVIAAFLHWLWSLPTTKPPPDDSAHLIYVLCNSNTFNLGLTKNEKG